MGEIIRFIPKSELERARLIREARANYERIFPSDHTGVEQPDHGSGAGKGPSDA
ncbi:hypothetical protein JQ604_37720 [Bradyrhizobium jicamae]|uniref:hypothetical protein n=1 Tax=Bradyrhizobium jicamae TaxID=280332 RepID=UPI001BA990B1|nr:hypothetical protein [Bradyrhizobium jicamae]MBR0757953.1 hypothetical protein [Bradyrhizobium jicamae]